MGKKTNNTIPARAVAAVRAAAADGLAQEEEKVASSQLMDMGNVNQAGTMGTLDLIGVGYSENCCDSEKTCSVPTVDRGPLREDLAKTMEVAALVGGFALGNMSTLQDDEFVTLAIYVLSALAVHMCTCSCLMSAFLFHMVNGLHEDHIHEWSHKNKWLFRIPSGKFTVGCVFYLSSVILLAYRDLALHSFPRYLITTVGAMTVSTVFMSYWYIIVRGPTVHFFQ